MDGLSARASRELRRYEQDHERHCSVAEALASWRDIASKKVAHRRAMAGSDDFLWDPNPVRLVLAQALTALSPPARRELLAKVEPLDALYRQHTLPDPHTPPAWPWWRRRW